MFRLWGRWAALSFKVQGLTFKGFRVQGLGFTVQGLGPRAGMWVYRVESRIWG